jgi:hypothetical protein
MLDERQALPADDGKLAAPHEVRPKYSVRARYAPNTNCAGRHSDPYQPSRN